MFTSEGLKNKLFWGPAVGFLLTVICIAGAVTKLKVIDTGGGRVYKGAQVQGKPIATLPLNTPLDGQSKVGQFWLVTIDKAGGKTTGYIHISQVAEVKEGEGEGAAGEPGVVTPQAALIGEIQYSLSQIKPKIQREEDLDKAADDLKILLAKTFRVENPQQQKQHACDIYFWMGQILARQGDEIAAIREYRNIYEVDEAAAKKILDYQTDKDIIDLIDIAERQYKNVFEGFTLRVETEPKDALIKINGEPKGHSPNQWELQTLRITLEIEKEGYMPVKETVLLKATKTDVSRTLKRLGRAVVVRSSPPGASVFLDGIDTGKVTDCEIPFVQFGPRTLRVAKAHYADWQENFTVSEGSEPLSKSVLLAAKDYERVASWGGQNEKIYVSPKALCLDKSGNFYVADESGIRLRKFNAEGRYQKTWASEGQQVKRLKMPSGIAADSLGNLYVTDQRGSCVVKFDKNGQFIKEWGPAGPKDRSLNGPLGIAVDGNGDVLVVDAGNSRVVKYSANGDWKRAWGKPGSGPGEFNQPAGVSITKNNDVMVIDLSRVQRFTPDGEFKGTFGKLGSGEAEFSRPLGICMDPDDNIYVADATNHRVQKLAPDGRFICEIGSGGTGGVQMTYPVGVAVDNNGRVFIIEKTAGRIQVFKVSSN